MREDARAASTPRLRLSRALGTALCALQALTISCAQTCVQQDGDRISAQRGLGQLARDPLGLAMELTPGLIPTTQPDASNTSMRASALVGQLTLALDSTISAPITLTITNLHPSVVARVISHQPLDDISPYAGLPLTEGRQRCPSSTLAQASACDGAQAAQGLCALPRQRRDQPDSTTLIVELDPTPCTGLTLELREPTQERDLDVSFAVIGRVREPAALQALTSLARQPGPLDMVIFLGDGNSRGDDDHLERLAQIVARSPVPLVVLPGSDEIQDGALAFGQRFGAYDFRWTFRGVQFLTFYSAERSLGLRGISLLESLLIAMAREDQRQAQLDGAPRTQARRWPALAMTHCPPLDPSGLRDRGLLSRVEAARVLSLLGRFGVSTLFAGGPSGPSTLGDAPQVRITSAQGNPLEPQAELLRVTLSRQPRPGASPVGDRFMTIEPIALPSAL